MDARLSQTGRQDIPGCQSKSFIHLVDITEPTSPPVNASSTQLDHIVPLGCLQLLILVNVDEAKS